MNVRILAFSVVLVGIASASLSAQNFFWSEFDLGEGATEGDFTVNAEVGDSGTAFLYYNPDGQIFGKEFYLSFLGTIQGSQDLLRQRLLTLT